MTDELKPAPSKRRADVFEIFEFHPTAHLTEEQKKWPVVQTGPSDEAALELVVAVKRLLALGATPESVTKTVADVLAAND